VGQEGQQFRLEMGLERVLGRVPEWVRVRVGQEDLYAKKKKLK
jgi:hypothetical protein